ncbi:MAG: type II toxin-antitoxin system HicA family toxin [Pseudomonadota bacterium]|nr:type II toxin-antitoxin system HicA family toxin [Pseudomonadota bacterium]
MRIDRGVDNQIGSSCAHAAQPCGDWTIKDVETLCREHGLSLLPPSRGSHYKVGHPSMSEILTIPFARPTKPVYIRHLVKFALAAGKAET